MNSLRLVLAVLSLFGLTHCAKLPTINENPGLWQFSPLMSSAYEALGSTAPEVLNTTPWVLPPGFVQRVVLDEAKLNIYKQTTCEQLGEASLARGADWPDMNTLNETGPQAGRYLYRTHEVRPFLYDAPCRANAPSSEQAINAFKSEGGGALSVLDTVTGEARVLWQRADLEALDGLLWTPWGSLLFAEEVIDSELADPAVPGAKSGLLYEAYLDPQNPRQVTGVMTRPALGSLAHEGIEFDAQGNIYVIDEHKTGSIYRFVPTRAGDLSQGQLYVLKVEGKAKTGMASWVALDSNAVQQRARAAAAQVAATTYCRPEDMERMADTLYISLTCEDVRDVSSTDGPGAVLAVKLTDQPQVNYFVSAGVNAPVENDKQKIVGFKKPDNLAAGPDGRLWIVEDNIPSEIWTAEPDRDGDGYADKVVLFAALRDEWAEGTGIYFSLDSKLLYVNVQHSRTGNDKTMVITRDR